MSEPLSPDIRELRKLKFASVLQLIAAIVFFGAGLLSGIKIGWGFAAFALLFFADFNILLFVVTRKAIAARTSS